MDKLRKVNDLKMLTWKEREMRANLNIGKEEDKVVLWRKLTRALSKLYSSKDVNKKFIKNNEPYNL